MRVVSRTSSDPPDGSAAFRPGLPCSLASSMPVMLPQLSFHNGCGLSNTPPSHCVDFLHPPQTRASGSFPKGNPAVDDHDDA